MEGYMKEVLDGKSMDITTERRAQLKQLFPSVFVETLGEDGQLIESIDFEKLKAELGTFTDLFENRRERYGMDWPGKKDALRVIQNQTYATLKPLRDESINFDTTKNLFIEGDNLEVLKLLQKSYYNKVKMIYIDPPYNTGNEFIYPDNFSENLDTYLEYAGLIDGDRKKFSTNTINEGRFHTKWLNMMYPRLYLARNLLRDDGVIFISIDDNEVHNLHHVMNEIFGEENFVACFPWKGRGGGADSKNLLENHEYILLYSKSNESFITGRKIKTDEIFPKYDEIKGKKYKIQLLRKWGSNSSREDRPNLYYAIKTHENVEIYPKLPNGNDGCWRWSKERALTALKNNDIEFAKKEDGNWEAYEKIYEPKDGESKTRLYSAWLQDEIYEELDDLLEDREPKSTAYGTKQLKEIFGGSAYFDYPKPTNLILILLKIANSNNSDIILDFFAGSCTTAHAVMQLNKEDGGNRKFICVQLPEPCAEDSEAVKAEYKTIADIGKERIRRVIKRLNDEEKEKLPLDNSNEQQDRGFKVFKLDQSNFKQWQKLSIDASEEEIIQQIELHLEHIRKTATPEDLLYEILLKKGVSLDTKIEKINIKGISTFSMFDGDFLICLEDKVTKELIDAVAEAQPSRFICLDSAFGNNDQLKANAVETFRAHNMGKGKYESTKFETI